MEEQCKLVIQIPCYNEEASLPITLRDIPGSIAGITSMEVLVIDDGSTDGTVEVAKANGVTKIVELRSRKGLATAFLSGLEASLELGADVIVNTDADNQYRGEDIEKLIRPIVEGRADIVIGNRRLDLVEDLPFIRKKLQYLGSKLVSYLSGVNVPDATSGFRAYNREAALKLDVLSDFTYTLETLVAAGDKGLSVENVEVMTNPDIRPSRLFRNTMEYSSRSLVTLVKACLIYKPLKLFSALSVSFLAIAVMISVFRLFHAAGSSSAGAPELMAVAVIFFFLGAGSLLTGVVLDLVAANRKLIERALFKATRKNTR